MLCRLRGPVLASSSTTRFLSSTLFGRSFAVSTDNNRGSTFIPPARPNDGFSPEARQDFEKLTKIKTEHEETRNTLARNHSMRQQELKEKQGQLKKDPPKNPNLLTQPNVDQFDMASPEAKPTLKQLLSLLEEGKRDEFRTLVSKNLARVQYQLWVASVSNLTEAEKAEKLYQARIRASKDPKFARAWKEEELEQEEILLEQEISNLSSEFDEEMNLEYEKELEEMDEEDQDVTLALKGDELEFESSSSSSSSKKDDFSLSSVATEEIEQDEQEGQEEENLRNKKKKNVG